LEVTTIAYNDPVAYFVVNTDLKKDVEVIKLHKNIHGFKLIGEFKTCEECAILKARQKHVQKEWKGGSQIPGEIFDFDISPIKNESIGGSKFGS
jgi:hypothetical protein